MPIVTIQVTCEATKKWAHFVTAGDGAVLIKSGSGVPCPKLPSMENDHICKIAIRAASGPLRKSLNG